MSLITIDQLLESVDLDFEPRFVTKDNGGGVWVWSGKPDNNMVVWNIDYNSKHTGCAIGKIKLVEFENKPWQECIYEVPRKTTGKIEKLPTSAPFGCQGDWREKINELVNYVNALIESNNIHEKQIDELQMKLEPEKLTGFAKTLSDCQN